MGAPRQRSRGEPQPRRPAFGVDPERVRLLSTDVKVVRSKEETGLIFIEGEIVSPDFPHPAGHSRLNKRQDGIGSSCNNEPPVSAGAAERMSELASGVIPV